MDVGHSENIKVSHAAKWSPGSVDQLQTWLEVGRPLSPYLFLLVAETLQALIRLKADDIRHPIVWDDRCVTSVC